MCIYIYIYIYRIIITHAFSLSKKMGFPLACLLRGHFVLLMVAVGSKTRTWYDLVPSQECQSGRPKWRDSSATARDQYVWLTLVNNSSNAPWVWFWKLYRYTIIYIYIYIYIIIQYKCTVYIVPIIYIYKHIYI